MNKKVMALSILWIIIGVVLFILSFMGIMEQSVWAGMGGGLIGAGIVRLVRYIKYSTNEEYKEKVDIQNSDERNKFLSNKAWAWAGYCYVIISAVVVIALMILGRPEYVWFSENICMMIVLYWLCYLILRRKY